MFSSLASYWHEAPSRLPRFTQCNAHALLAIPAHPHGSPADSDSYSKSRLQAARRSVTCVQLREVSL